MACYENVYGVCESYPSVFRDDDQYLWGYVDNILDYYHETLKNTVRGIEFLERRGLLDLEMMDYFHLGFSDRSLHTQLPKAQSLEGCEIRGFLERVGIQKPSGRELFQGCLVVPFTDQYGRVVGGFGRRVTPKLASRSVYYVHWKTSMLRFFNELAFDQYQSIYLCKSPMEAMTLWVAGVKNVVSLIGIRAFCQLHRQYLRNAQLENITVLVDSTKQGRYFFRKVQCVVKETNANIYQCNLPSGKDVNQMWLASRYDASFIRDLLSHTKRVNGREKGK